MATKQNKEHDAIQEMMDDARQKFSDNLGAYFDLVRKSHNDFFDTVQEFRTKVFDRESV